MNLYREATRDEIAIDDLGVASAVDVYTMDVVAIKGPVYLWCKTHARIPEDGIDLCGDEWRDIGECVFVRAMLVEIEEDSTP